MVDKVKKDRCNTPEYKEMIKEEIDNFNKVQITKELKLGGIHDYEAWH